MESRRSSLAGERESKRERARENEKAIERETEREGGRERERDGGSRVIVLNKASNKEPGGEGVTAERSSSGDWEMPACEPACYSCCGALKVRFAIQP